MRQRDYSKYRRIYESVQAAGSASYAELIKRHGISANTVRRFKLMTQEEFDSWLSGKQRKQPHHGAVATRKPASPGRSAPGASLGERLGRDIENVNLTAAVDQYKSILKTAPVPEGGHADRFGAMADRITELMLTQKMLGGLPNNNGHESDPRIAALEKALADEKADRNLSEEKRRFDQVIAEIGKIKDAKHAASDGNLKDIAAVLALFQQSQIQIFDILKSQGGNDISQLAKNIDALGGLVGKLGKGEAGEKSKVEILADVIGSTFSSVAKSPGVQDALSGIGNKLSADAQARGLSALQSRRLQEIQRSRVGNPNNGHESQPVSLPNNLLSNTSAGEAGDVGEQWTETVLPSPAPSSSADRPQELGKDFFYNPSGGILTPSLIAPELTSPNNGNLRQGQARVRASDAPDPGGTERMMQARQQELQASEETSRADSLRLLVEQNERAEQLKRAGVDPSMVNVSDRTRRL